MTTEGFGFFEANLNWLWTGIISGFNGDHIQTSASLEGKIYPLGGRFGLGGIGHVVSPVQ